MQAKPQQIQSGIQTATMVADLPEGWESLMLKDCIAQMIGGDWGSTPNQKPDGWVDVRVIRGTEFREWETNKGSTAAHRTIKPSSYQVRHLLVGDIVLEVSGGGPDQPVGRSILIDKAAVRSSPLPLICSNFCRKIRLDSNIDSAYANLCLRWKYGCREFDRFQNQTVNLRNLQVPEFVNETKLPLPPLAEQKRIVAKVEELLGRVKTVRQRLAKVPAILKRFRQSVLAAARSGRLTADWRNRHNSHPAAKVFVASVYASRKNTVGASRAMQSRVREPVVDTEFVDLPEPWCRTRIGDVTECLDYLRIPINKDARKDRVGGIPYYGANGQVGWIDKHLFDEELVLVVEDESFIGREKPFSYVIRGKSWVNNHAHVLRPLNGMPATYLDVLLAFYDFVPLTSGTTGRRKLNQSVLLDAPIPLAPLAEQHEIVRRVEALFKLADAIEKRVAAASARADKLTQSILAKAFRGQLVPTEASLAQQEGRPYEPASALLARIRAERQDSAASKPASTKQRTSAKRTPTN